MQPTFITLNNYQYRYVFYPNANTQEYGVFLMGTLQDIESVSFFSEKFSEHLNLFVVEVPGTGLTNPLSATFSIQDQAAMLLDFIYHMNIFNAHILSISYATTIALELCTQWSNAISLSMYGGMTGIPDKSRPASMAILYDAIYNRKKFAESFIDLMTVNSSSIPRGKVIARSAKLKILKNPEKQIECFCENTIRLLAYKPSNNISKILCPCLLIIGEQDPYVTVNKARELALQLPNCTFEIIKNADHLAHLEYPSLIANLMSHTSKNYLHNNGFKSCQKV